MTIQTLTWLNGISALVLICSAWIMAFITLKYYFRDKNKRRINEFIFLAAVALGWTGITITFLSVAIYGYNLPWVRGAISYFSYSTIPFGATAIIIFTWDVFGSPKYKKAIIGVFLGLSIVYYIILFATFSQAIVCPEVPRGEIYDDWINPTSILFYLIWIIISITTIIMGTGFNKFRKMTAGDLKKRAGFMILASFLVGSGVLLDTVVLGSIIQPHEYFLYIVRFLTLIGAFCSFWGLRQSKIT